MSEHEERDEISELLEKAVPKPAIQVYVETTWPNLPAWIVAEYGHAGWAWMSAQEREDILKYGTERPGRIAPYGDY